LLKGREDGIGRWDGKSLVTARETRFVESQCSRGGREQRTIYG